MNRGARVTSIETVQEFRNKLCEFGKDAKDVLCGAEMQVRRMIDWLKERLKHWQREIKVRQEEVTRAKIELQSRKAMCKDGKGPGTSDQERALYKAMMRLKEAEEKVAACKRWDPLLQHAIHEYHGPARQLGGYLDTDLVHGLALLQQKLEALEAYLALAPPSTPMPANAGSSAEEPRMTAGSSSTTVTAATPGNEAPQETADQEANGDAGQPAGERITP